MGSLGVVARGRELEDAVDVVLDVAVGREQRAVAGGGHAQRMLLLGLRCGRAWRMKMLAASSWWLPNSAIRPAAGAVPEPPADQFLDRRAVVDHLARGVLDRQVLVAELLGIDARRRSGRGAARCGSLSPSIFFSPVGVASCSCLSLSSVRQPFFAVPCPGCRPADRRAWPCPGIGCCQLSWPGRLPRCHWARMWCNSPSKPLPIISTALS